LKSLIRVILSAADWRSSLIAGLAALPGDCQWVIVHDAARPLVHDVYFAKGLWAALAMDGVALAAEPITDTLKRVAGGHVDETLPRASLRRLETPLVIRRDLLARALQAAPDAAGLAAIAQSSGARVALYTPPGINPSVKNETDWAAAEDYLMKWVHYPFLAEGENPGWEV
jgi:2-C-methyl-D-erythritol 4-phosphate cytidylyltransferase